jgi:glycosyltransferase involved in cell wall biosynthesis
MSARPLWYIITPVYKPAPGGAAVYADLLARALAQDGANVVIVTEAFGCEPRHESVALGAGSVTVDRMFPMRAGRSERDWRSYFAYAIQNLRMMALPRHLDRSMRRAGAASVTILIHSSLFYNPSVLPSLLRRMRRTLSGRAKVVIDVRDPKFDDRLAPILAQADAAIGCSRAIAGRLREIAPARVQVRHVPIPFDAPELPTESEVAAILKQFELADLPYIFNPNGVSDEKGYPGMLKVMHALRALPGEEQTELVTIGRARDWHTRDDKAVAEGILRYLGPVPNATALALAAGARATMILSRVEGLPRSGLETLAIGKPLLAPDIAEFRETIPASVAQSDDPATLARQLVELTSAPSAERYPLERHRMVELVQVYRELGESGAVQEIAE